MFHSVPGIKTPFTHTRTHTRSLPLLLPTSGAVNRPHFEILLLVVILRPLPDHPKHRHTFCHSARNNGAFVSMAGLASDSTHTSTTWPEPGLISGIKMRGFSFKSSPCNDEDSFHLSGEFPRPSPRWSFMTTQPRGEKRKEWLWSLPVGRCWVYANCHLHSIVCVSL